MLLSTGGVNSLTTGTAVGIAVVATAVVIFTAEALATVLVYCISKHRSQGSKPESSSHQQQLAASTTNPPKQTGPEYEEVIELSENMAYRPVQGIEVRANEAYQPVQH